MSHRILPGIATLASITLVSCYPYPEQDPYYDVPPQGHGYQPSVTSPQQQEIERQREQARREEERKRQADRQQDEARSTPRETTQSGSGSQPRESGTQSKPETKPSTDYPFATPVVGQEGFVLSPYNQKKVDVRGIQSGTLVQDPTYPAAEKKYFRVP